MGGGHHQGTIPSGRQARKSRCRSSEVQRETGTVPRGPSRLGIHAAGQPPRQRLPLTSILAQKSINGSVRKEARHPGVSCKRKVCSAGQGWAWQVAQGQRAPRFGRKWPRRGGCSFLEGTRTRPWAQGLGFQCSAPACPTPRSGGVGSSPQQPKPLTAESPAW